MDTNVGIVCTFYCTAVTHPHIRHVKSHVMSTPVRGRRRKRSSPVVLSNKRKPCYASTMAGVDTSLISDTETEDNAIFSSQPIATKQEKSTQKARQPAIYKSLLNIFSDPDSPVMQALATSIVKPISDSIQNVLKQQTEQLAKITTRLDKLESDSKDKDIKIRSLEREIDELQQYGRRNAIVISGVPESDGENTDQIALDLAREKLKVSLDSHEISRSHRLGPPRPGTPRPRNIVVKLATYNIRKRLYDARRSLMSTGIYISEHLTKYRGDLFYDARQIQKRGLVKHAWTSDGRVLVRDHGGKAFLIQSKSDLAQFSENTQS